MLTDATVGLILIQFPPITGDKVLVAPRQIEEGPDITAYGLLLINKDFVGFEVHPSVFVNVKVTCPGAKAVTLPALSTEATPLLELVHVPVLLLKSVVFSPKHKILSPAIDAFGFAKTVTGNVGSEVQFVAVSL